MLDAAPGDAFEDRPISLGETRGAGQSASCWCETESWSLAGGEILVVRVNGEVDLNSDLVLALTLDRALARAPRSLVVDLREVTFCSLRGYQMFAQAALSMAEWGARLALCGVTAHQDRVAAIVLPLGWDRYRSIGRAVLAIRAAASGR